MVSFLGRCQDVSPAPPGAAPVPKCGKVVEVRERSLALAAAEQSLKRRRLGAPSMGGGVLIVRVGLVVVVVEDVRVKVGLEPCREPQELAGMVGGEASPT